MNENRSKDVASFVLGIIVTTIIYLLVKREFDKIVGGGKSKSANGGGGGGGSHASGGGCGCGGLASGSTSTNPQTSPGANSLDGNLAFPNSVSSNGGMSHATFSE